MKGQGTRNEGTGDKGQDTRKQRPRLLVPFALYLVSYLYLAPCISPSQLPLTSGKGSKIFAKVGLEGIINPLNGRDIAKFRACLPTVALCEGGTPLVLPWSFEYLII